MERVGLLFSGELLTVFGAAVLVSRSVRGGDRLWPTFLGLGTGLSILPYLAIGVVAVLLATEFWRRQITGPIAGLILGGGSMMALVIGRLLIAHRELGGEAAARAARELHRAGP